MSKKNIFSFTLVCILLIFNPLRGLHANDRLKDLVRDESVSGARASMGLFISPFNKSLNKNLFHFSSNSLQGRLVSISLAAVGYQSFYYDKQYGLQVDPFKLNKSWRGFWTGYFAGEGMDLFLSMAKKSKYCDYIIAGSLFLSISAITLDGEMNQTWRVSHNSPLTFDNIIMNRHSYWTHFAATGGLYWILSNHTNSSIQALLYTIGLAWLWEYKDGYVRTESKFRYFGGEGFSYSDAAAGTLAATGSFLFDELILKNFNRLVHKENRYSLSVFPYSNQPGIAVKLLF